MFGQRVVVVDIRPQACCAHRPVVFHPRTVVFDHRAREFDRRTVVFDHRTVEEFDKINSSGFSTVINIKVNIEY